jgi:4-carboxymuconolactone decarboxylase
VPHAHLRTCRGNTFAQRRDAAILSVFRAPGIRLAELAGIRYEPDDPGRSDLGAVAQSFRVTAGADHGEESARSGMMSTTVHRLNAVIRRQQLMDDAQADRAAFDTAERLLGAPLVLPLGPGEPPSGADFRRLATRHAFGDSWTRTGLDVRSRALVSVTIAATLGTREPLRGQLRIALNNGVTKDEIVDLFIHLEAYAGAARAFDSYQIALEIFAETTGTE